MKKIFVPCDQTEKLFQMEQYMQKRYLEIAKEFEQSFSDLGCSMVLDEYWLYGHPETAMDVHPQKMENYEYSYSCLILYNGNVVVYDDENSWVQNCACLMRVTWQKHFWKREAGANVELFDNMSDVYDDFKDNLSTVERMARDGTLYKN